MDFSEWLVGELEKRGWSRTEAAKRGSISPSMYDKVINGHSKPGMKFIEGVAKAFKMPAAEVMMHVNYQDKNDNWVEETTYKIRLLNPQYRGIVSTFIDSFLKGEDNSQPDTPKRSPKHKSSTP